MALKGQLSDFNLAEILQLIASQQKSGFLTVEAQREMIFIFDKGVLVSTRDRRSETRDPLRSYLRAYGFFTDAEWKNIDYVRKNSTLDLTEILLSEGLLKDEELTRVLKSIAQEMTHHGMKLRRGRYHFNPTKGAPPGVRSPFRLDVQGLLMEAARRLDEERLLKEALPSPAITFTQGDKSLPAEALSPTARHIMQLALAGQALGKIIRQGRVESFVTLDLLKNWCDEGVLVLHLPGGEEDESGPQQSGRTSLRRKLGLRSLPATVVLVLLLAGVGWLRWAQTPVVVDHAGEPLRQAQLRAEVVDAASLYRYAEGQWPTTLGELVRTGHLSPATLATVETLGWRYQLDPARDRFSLGG